MVLRIGLLQQTNATGKAIALDRATENGILEEVNMNEGVSSRLQTEDRKITDIKDGSLIYTIHCPTLVSVLDLWVDYTSGRLQKFINNTINIEKYREKHKMDDLYIDVDMHMEGEPEGEEEMPMNLGRGINYSI